MDTNSEESPERTSRSAGERPDQPDRLQQPDQIDRGLHKSSDQDPDLRLLRQNQGRWKLSFSMFLLGFMLLIVVAKRDLPTGETWALRLVAALLCVGAFFLARQARRKRHG